MNPSHSPNPSSPDPAQQRKGTAKPLAVRLVKIEVAIVDDDENFRLFVQDILNQARKFHCAGSYCSGEEALTGIPQSGAQIVLMDIKMPGMSGIECARRLKALRPHLIIVMITGLTDQRTMSLAHRCGADRFLPKPFTADNLLAELSFCTPEPKTEAGAQRPKADVVRRGASGARALTAREYEVMKWVAKGLLDKEIADKLRISPGTVHNYVRSAFAKLGVANRTEAAIKFLGRAAS